MGATTWSWIARTVETMVISKALEHISRVIEVAECAHKLFLKFRDGSREGVLSTYSCVYESEKKADEVKRTIIKELSEGFIHPIDREELIRLVLTVDDIAAYVKAACRRACLVNPRDVDPTIRDYLIEMISRVVKSVKLLKEAIEVLRKEPKKALELADNVERIEEEVDEIRIKALAEVLKLCDKSRPSVCLMAKDIVDSLENSEDRCEDSADVIRSIAILRS